MAWVYSLSPPNLLDLAIKKEKIITKQKALARRPDEMKRFLACPTCHNETFSTN